MRSYYLSFAVLSLPSLVLAKPLTSRGIHFKGPIEVEPDSLHNIHIGYDKDTEGVVRVVYGGCDMNAEHERHHHITVTLLDDTTRPDRLIWIVPRDIPSNGCLHAFSSDRLVGRSAPISVSEPLRKRQLISDVADEEGPWFDGVVSGCSISLEIIETIRASWGNKTHRVCRQFWQHPSTTFQCAQFARLLQRSHRSRLSLFPDFLFVSNSSLLRHIWSPGTSVQRPLLRRRRRRLL